MRALVPLFLLAVGVAQAIPHIQNEFKIAIPHKPASPGAQALHDSTFAVLTDEGITAVDLATKRVAWSKNSSSATSFYINNGNMLVVGSEYVQGLNAATGNMTWQNSSVSTFSDAADIKFQSFGDNVVVSTEDQLFSVNAGTGRFLYHMSLSGTGVSSGKMLYFATANGELAALNIETGVKPWTINARGGNTFNNVLYADANYVVTSIDTTGGDTVLFVALASNGNQKLRLEGMSGLNQDSGPVSVSGTNLTVVAGENPRVYTIDLNTGYILSQTPYSGGGGGNGGGSQGEHHIDLSDGDVIKIHSTSSQTTPAKYGSGFSIQKGPSGGPFTTVCPHTASDSHYNLAYLGDGLLKVGNLQGYTLFYIKDQTCSVVQRDETLPGYRAHRGGSVFKYGKDFVEVEGKEVVGYKIVQ